MCAISGIMVDGDDVGDTQKLMITNECSNNCDGEVNHCSDCDSSFLGSDQDFSDAEVLVVDSNPIDKRNNESSESIADGSKTYRTVINEHRYACYAVYGNTVVKSRIYGEMLYQLQKKKSVKIVWALKKPYILNGDTH